MSSEGKRRLTSSYFWDQWEVEAIKEAYPVSGVLGVWRAGVRRSAYAIKTKAQHLGLSVAPEVRRELIRGPHAKRVKSFEQLLRKGG